ncbi:MAG: DedA family protein [Candidatus Sungbacteria bacterium]|nr:DedA family protein [Candidatus Sungbacteria bacterium]
MSLLWYLISFDHRSLIYAALFSILVFSGVGLPMPEEVTLLFGGYLAYVGFIHFWPAVYILLLGNITGDIMGYCVGRFFGAWMYRTLFARFQLTAKLFKKGEEYFSRHGERIVFFTRPLIGVRAAIPLLAGHFKMNFFKFVLFDIIITIPWTFAIVFASYALGTGLEWLTEVRIIRHMIFAVIGVAVLFFLAVQYTKNNRPVP